MATTTSDLAEIRDMILQLSDVYKDIRRDLEVQRLRTDLVSDLLNAPHQPAVTVGPFSPAPPPATTFPVTPLSAPSHAGWPPPIASPSAAVQIAEPANRLPFGANPNTAEHQLGRFVQNAPSPHLPSQAQGPVAGDTQFENAQFDHRHQIPFATADPPFAPFASVVPFHQQTPSAAAEPCARAFQFVPVAQPQIGHQQKPLQFANPNTHPTAQFAEPNANAAAVQIHHAQLANLNPTLLFASAAHAAATVGFPDPTTPHFARPFAAIPEPVPFAANMNQASPFTANASHPASFAGHMNPTAGHSSLATQVGSVVAPFAGEPNLNLQIGANAPPDYEPSFFRSCTADKTHNQWTKNPLKMDAGNVNSKDFVLAVKVMRVLDPCEGDSDSNEEDEVSLGADSAEKDGSSDTDTDVGSSQENQYIIAPAANQQQSEDGVASDDGTRDATNECKITVDIVESALPRGILERNSQDGKKMQEMFHKALALLPELWKNAGRFDEAILSYRRALGKPWNLSPSRPASVQRDVASILLYGGVETTQTSQISNLEETILLLFILVSKMLNQEIEWDQEIMDHLTYGLSICGGFKFLADHFEQVFPGIYDRPERWYILAPCYSACGQNEVALNLPKKIADVIQVQRHIPFFDVAYQGFASGSLDVDASSVRAFAEQGMEVFVAQSYSKNLGLYAERVGALNVVYASAEAAVRVKSQLKRLARPLLPLLHFMFDPGIWPNEEVLLSLKELVLRSIRLFVFDPGIDDVILWLRTTRPDFRLEDKSIVNGGEIDTARVSESGSTREPFGIIVHQSVTQLMFIYFVFHF